MTRRMLLVALLLLWPVQLAAQQNGPGGWSVLRISKWSMLAGTLGAAVYGVATVGAADDDYERLERACQAEPLLCRRRDSGGSYESAQLEQQYQSVLQRDRRARTALLASQAGVAATVVLFILDLRHARAPASIPYHPRTLEVRPDRQGRLELRLTVPAR